MSSLGWQVAQQKAQLASLAIPSWLIRLGLMEWAEVLPVCIGRAAAW